MERRSFGLSPSLSLIMASAFWGVGTVISKELLGTVPPILFLLIQLAPSVAALWLVIFAGKLQPRSWSGLLPIMVLGLLNPGLSYTLSILGLAHTSASAATLIWAAEPALIVVFAGLLLREHMTPSLIALTAMAGLGVILASGATDFGSIFSQNGYGALLILAGVLCCAVYSVLFRLIGSDMEPLFVVAVQQSVGLVWAAAIWSFEWHGNGMDQLLSLSSRELLGGSISGLMYYAIAFWLYLNGLRSMPASRAGNFLNLIPVFGIAVAYVFLGERLSSWQWLGAIIILFSVFALQSRLASPGHSVTVKRST